MTDNSSKIFETPESELDEDDTELNATTLQIMIAIFIFLLYAASNIYFANLAGKNSSALIGVAIGSAIWPLIIVGISSIWKSNRNSKSRVKIFTITSALLLALQIVTFIAVSTVSH